ncbi:LysR family transcriptional regulator [Azohydromonas caseinilytica]|uniref:LysR family transcriptional regulator n=1 Tax=Azohydromonas caseinilytica TaxID=2728836 RepID=A0A848FHX4_9BURK|nr:LysR family transcriptional regulator [Azohydromonas caseinilytica]NML19078.1 LysR family transcriptional regulator [Azohydromonas caseinilytica]
MANPAPSVPRLDPYSLRLFVAAAEAGSIARAAEREHIAASALSRRIADLEHALGVALLVRSARGIELTEAGRCVFERGTRIEAELQGLVSEVWGLSGNVVGTVRLYANASAIVGELPERLQAFKQRYPAVKIALQEQRSWEVMRACLDDRADLGIAVATQAPKGLDSWHFASDPLIVLLPAGHELTAQTRIAFKDIAGSGLVGIQAGGALDQLIHERAEVARVPLRIEVTVNSFDAACRMVQAGLGAAIVPTSAATAYAGSGAFERRELAESWAQRELRLYALHKSPRLRAVDVLIDMLQR